jgi:hypothetical protein
MWVGGRGSKTILPLAISFGIMFFLSSRMVSKSSLAGVNWIPLLELIEMVPVFQS